MSLRRLLENNWFMRVLLVLWIVSAVFVLFLFTRVDSIVHDQLYSFGLRFSDVWAAPYWGFARLIYVCLGVPMALSAFVLALGFTRKIDDGRKGNVKQEVKQEARPKPKPVNNGPQNMVVSCPSCRKVFSRPLVMLDFGSGKPKLVNVCPYCNRVLGTAENEKEAESETQIADADEKLTH